MPANNVADRKAFTLYKSPRPQDTLCNPSPLKNGAGSIATCAARVARHAPPSHTVVPVFAIAVRRAYDYGPAAGRAMQDKRAASFACGTLVVRDVDLPSKDVVQSYKASDPESPIIFRRGEIADAAPAVPGWRMRVEELCG